MSNAMRDFWSTRRASAWPGSRRWCSICRGCRCRAPVVDIVYVPLETSLLAAAEHGHPVVDGLGMLLHQGRPGFEAWFGAAVRVRPRLRAADDGDLAPPR